MSLRLKDIPHCGADGVGKLNEIPWSQAIILLVLDLKFSTKNELYTTKKLYIS